MVASSQKVQKRVVGAPSCQEKLKSSILFSLDKKLGKGGEIMTDVYRSVHGVEKADKESFLFFTVLELRGTMKGQ